MLVIHTSLECYPVAKTGGLGDVVGSLPKYLNRKNVNAWVVMPKYDNEWANSRSYDVVHEGATYLGSQKFHYRMLREKQEELGFPLYMVDIPGRTDRPGVYVDPVSGYPYWDEFERYISFQLAVLDWFKSFPQKPDVIHCHDHHTALIPFLINSCYIYSDLITTPTVLTIHNGEYHGSYDMGKAALLPKIKPEKFGFLEWDNRLNSLASGIRNCWKLTTVSTGYLGELQTDSSGLETLMQHEASKSLGIINGIDDQVWDPAADPLIAHNFSAKTLEKGKKLNKEVLCNEFGLNPKLPVFSYIGRLAKEKGADMLPDLITSFLEAGNEANFIVLGTGDPYLHHVFNHLKGRFVGYFNTSLQYNEKLAHQIYAGSDFLLMPSRVEPCGLNQMYALKYGTIPIVRRTGGLNDTVVDVGEPDGYGVCFNQFSLEDAYHAVSRAHSMYKIKDHMKIFRNRAVALDFSWDKSADKYIELYQSLNT